MKVRLRDELIQLARIGGDEFGIIFTLSMIDVRPY